MEETQLTHDILVSLGFQAIPDENYINGTRYHLQVTKEGRDGTWFDGIGTHAWRHDGKSLAVNILCRGNYVGKALTNADDIKTLYRILTGEPLEFVQYRVITTGSFTNNSIAYGYADLLRSIPLQPDDEFNYKKHHSKISECQSMKKGEKIFFEPEDSSVFKGTAFSVERIK